MVFFFLTGPPGEHQGADQSLHDEARSADPEVGRDAAGRSQIQRANSEMGDEC